VTTQGSIRILETIKLLDQIRTAHPDLQMKLDTKPRQVDVELTIPAQEGLPFRVGLSLQGDELHLEAGDHFRAEWFPCNDAEVARGFSDAVNGLLAGRYRIVEYIRRGKTVRAELQAPEESGWQIMTAWTRLHLPIPRRVVQRVLIRA
jgi:hypothetical protein